MKIISMNENSPEILAVITVKDQELSSNIPTRTIVLFCVDAQCRDIFCSPDKNIDNKLTLLTGGFVL